MIDSDPSSDTRNTIIGALEGPTAPTAIAISPNGAFVYVLNLNNQIISKVGTRSGVVEGQLDLGGVGTLAGIALTADGSTAFVSNDVGTVYAIRTSSMTLVDDPNNPIPVDPGALGVAAR